jgi:hypothetical protein
MSNSCTIAYSATAVGPTTVTALETAMGLVALDEGAIETITGCTLTSDSTTSAGQVVTRTIVFNLTPAAFQANFPPPADQSAPFWNLYTGALAAALFCPVVAANPVLA